jgi:hypothetical protein
MVAAGGGWSEQDGEQDDDFWGRSAEAAGDGHPRSGGPTVTSLVFKSAEWEAVGESLTASETLLRKLAFDQPPARPESSVRTHTHAQVHGTDTDTEKKFYSTQSYIIM